MLTFTNRGIYCPQADVYLDPWRPVDRAIISHGHSDHARWGHKHYLATPSTVAIMKHRLGNTIVAESMDFGKELNINGVKFSFHPAGHIIGSAQIRCEYKGEVWVFTGDYKLQNDGLSEPYELVKCNAFITETTFGLPVFRWKPQAEVQAQINQWWKSNAEAGKVSLLAAYSLGKAQRILSLLDQSHGKVYVHNAIGNMNDVLKKHGIKLPAYHRVGQLKDQIDYTGALVIAPPSAISGNWSKRFKQTSTAIASGWMALRGMRRRRAVDRGFVLSDHCDWDALNTAIKATECERVFVTHGYTDTFCQWLREQGYKADIVSTDYQGENLDQKESLELNKA